MVYRTTHSFNVPPQPPNKRAAKRPQIAAVGRCGGGSALEMDDDDDGNAEAKTYKKPPRIANVMETK